MQHKLPSLSADCAKYFPRLCYATSDQCSAGGWREINAACGRYFNKRIVTMAPRCHSSRYLFASSQFIFQTVLGLYGPEVSQFSILFRQFLEFWDTTHARGPLSINVYWAVTCIILIMILINKWLSCQIIFTHL